MGTASGYELSSKTRCCHASNKFPLTGYNLHSIIQVRQAIGYKKKKLQQRCKSGQPRGCYQANTNKKSVAAYLKDTQNSQHPENPKSPDPF